MDISPIAYFRSPLREKFGIPRQSGLAPSLRGRIELEGQFRNPDALRGLDGFDYLWLIWGFSANHKRDAAPGAPLSSATRSETIRSEAPRSEASRDKTFAATVRPPRLGGNRSIGVFASRSPFRPNPLGLSSVRILSIDLDACTIEVSGADLLDGTPIYDIKPYVPYSDSHPDARSGFVDALPWQPLEVAFPQALRDKLAALTGDTSAPAAAVELLSQDPRPHYQDDPDRIYGMAFGPANIRFRVASRTLTVLDVQPEKDKRINDQNHELQHFRS